MNRVLSRSRRGQGLAEYFLILVLVALAAFTACDRMGSDISAHYLRIKDLILAIIG